ncbi:MAG: DUF58 domain-containing protein [Xanthomonadales bacterium]|nr:DUF58 domain-containing protein [Xanthomonadales bacterium]
MKPTTTGLRAEVAELLALRSRAMELLAGYRRRSASRESGPSHSAFRGRGMDYAESRPYAPGDDVRHIDWRVTARTGRAHSKVFQAERDRVTAVVVDRSASMAFGTRNCLKSVAAARLGALLAWTGSMEGDRLATISDGEVVPPTRGRSGILRVLNALSSWSEGSGAAADPVHSLNRSLERLPRLIRPGSHVLLLADARSIDTRCEPALRALSAHHDVIAMLVCDALERHAPPAGHYLATGPDGVVPLDLDSDEARERWFRHFDDLQQTALAHLAGCGIRAHRVATDDDPVDALRDLLRGVSEPLSREQAA